MIPRDRGEGGPRLSRVFPKMGAVHLCTARNIE